MPIFLQRHNQSIMKLAKYSLSAGSNLTTFEFVSEGPNGLLTKLVQYSPTNLKGVYNLAFGDKNNLTGKIDDKVISNNGDSEKVLATIVSTVYAFTDKYPDALVFATGSNVARTRLYRMGISKYLSEAEDDFDIYGQVEESWETFRKDINYEGFLIKRKKIKFGYGY